MKKLKKLRTIVFDENKIIVDDKFGQNIFDLSQACKVSIKAWFRENNENSYIILTLKNGENKIRLITSTQVNLNFCTKDDIIQFKLLIDRIDNYALKNNIKKNRLKKILSLFFCKKLLLSI